jgi:hypothetical protein
MALTDSRGALTFAVNQHHACGVEIGREVGLLGGVRRWVPADPKGRTREPSPSRRAGVKWARDRASKLLVAGPARAVGHRGHARDGKLPGV